MLESDPVISGFSPKVLVRDQFFDVDVQRKHGAFIVNDLEQHKPGKHWVLVVMLPYEVICFHSFAKSPRHYTIDKHLHKMNGVTRTTEQHLWRILYVFWKLFMSWIQT